MEKNSIKRNEDFDLYAAGIRSFDQIAKNLQKKDLDKRRAEGKWTIRQIIHHIADAETLWNFAIKAALGNPGCTFDFSWYIHDNKWAGPLFYHSRGIGPATALFRESRKEIVELLPLFQDPWSHQFTLNHDKLPEGTLNFTVLKAVQWQIRHLDIHLTQIQESL